MGDRTVRVWRWLAGVAVRAFPVGQRERRGAEMVDTFEARLREVRAVGRAAAVGFAVRELVAFVVHGSRARRGQRAARKRGATGDGLLLDARYAVRAMGRSPGFFAVAVLVLGIGIGASVAIFSVVDAVMFRPLPLREPDRLVAMWEENVERGWVRAQVAPANYLDWRERLTAFTDIAAYDDYLFGAMVESGTGSARAQVSVVTGNFFAVLGVRPLVGRAFTDEETWSGGERVVILSEGLWRRLFGGDRAIVGQTIEVNRAPARVVGVMPASLGFPREATELWAPVGWGRSDVSQVFFRRAHSMRVVGRLAPGVNRERAEAELDALMTRLAEEYPDTNEGMEAGLAPLRNYLVADTRGPMLALIAAVAVLLLLSCVNVANLLLVRGVGRDREMAVRGALGAVPGRLLRQLLTETVLLAGLAGAAGVGAGLLGTRLLTQRLPAEIESMEPIAVDVRVLAFALALTVLTATVFGLLPALRGARSDVGRVLRDGMRAGASRATLRAGAGLVVLEIALAVVLVAGAGLLAKSAWSLSRVDPGFDPEGVLSVALSIPNAGYESRDQVLAVQTALLERVRALPGVVAAGATSAMPLLGEGWSSDFSAAGWEVGRAGTEVRHREIMPGFLEALGTPLLRGRAFDERDTGDHEFVVLINEALASTYFANEDPIGRRVAFDTAPDSTSLWWTIVGVVGNVRQFGLRGSAAPEFLAPATQDWRRTLNFLIRTDGDPLDLVPAVRAVVDQLDAGLPLFDVRTMEQVRATAYARDRFVLTLFAAFAAIALLLALVGVYGVAAQATRRRTHEIGIRMALGAERHDVLRMVLSSGMRLVLLGLTAGLLAALAGTRLIAGLLFNVPATDPLVYTVVATTLACAGMLACWLPARRAAHTDPLIALRSD